MLQTKTPPPQPQKIGLPQWKKYWSDKRLCNDLIRKGIVKEAPEVMKKIFHVGPYFLIVINYATQSFELVQGCEQMLGFPDQDMYDGKVDFLAELLHPEDRDKVLGLAMHFYQFVDRQPKERRLDFRVSLNFRMRNSSGQYTKMLEQVVALKMDEEGRVTHALKYFTSISHLQYTNEVVLSVLDEGEDGRQQFYTFDLEDGSRSSFNGGAETTLSAREREVLALIASGKTSKEISDQLNISTFTVNKHRENMMRRTGCKNMSEVISFAYCHDYL